MTAEGATELGRSTLRVPLAVRVCRAEDLPLLEWYGQFAHHREIFAAAFARHVRGDNLMLVADIGGFPVGQAWVDLAKRQSDSIGYIWAVRVFPFLRNLGVGAELMACAETATREHGYAVAEVGVERSNPRARRFYERLGYGLVSEISEEYSYTTPDGVHARQVVDQWLLHKHLA